MYAPRSDSRLSCQVRAKPDPSKEFLRPKRRMRFVFRVAADAFVRYASEASAPDECVRGYVILAGAKNKKLKAQNGLELNRPCARHLDVNLGNGRHLCHR